MKKNIFHFVTYVLFIFVVLGSIGLLYVQNIDGVLVNKPVEFYIDKDHMKTDKPAYHRGDTVSILTSFCRFRSYRAITTWRLINSYQITLAEKDTQNAPGCTKDKWIAIAQIPPFAVSGKHHLEGTSVLQLNNLNSIPVTFRSEDFEVI